MKLLILLLIITIFLPLVEAATIDISIVETLSIETKRLKESVDDNVLDISTELYNTGSIGYSVRKRVDIYQDSEILYSGWSRQKEITPGSRKAFDFSWYDPNASGECVARVRFYLANEIRGEEDIVFNIEKTSPEESFIISDFRTYDKNIRFYLTSLVDVENIKILPNSPNGWIFEQYSIKKMRSGEVKEIFIPYEANYFSDRDIEITVVTGDSNHYHLYNANIIKDSGASFYFNILIDSVKRFFISLF